MIGKVGSHRRCSWLPFLQQRVFKVRFFQTIRITSYNVCYTKLLRFEEAAMDLGANELTTFWRVTLPMIMPGVLSGALLAFTLSLDDFVITFFTTGPGASTLPIYVYGLLRRIVITSYSIHYTKLYDLIMSELKIKPPPLQKMSDELLLFSMTNCEAPKANGVDTKRCSGSTQIKIIFV